MKFKKLTLIFFGILMMLAGTMHFLKPKMYFPFIPDFLPKYAITFISGQIEIFLGIMIFYKKTRVIGTIGILILMISFLPLHFIDMFRSQPAIGSQMLAIIRFPIQLILIWMAVIINKKSPIVK